MRCTVNSARLKRRPINAVQRIEPVRRRYRHRRLASVIACALALLILQRPVWATDTNTHDHPEPEVLAPGYEPLAFDAPTAGSYQLPLLGDAAAGPVIRADGTATDLASVLGQKITVLSFIYTRCNDVNGCPLASFVLRQLQDRVREDSKLRSELRLVSLSFDPVHDSPDVLARYQQHFLSLGFDWQFLTTPNADALQPILDAYDQFVIRDRDAEGNDLGTISHLLRVYLIDTQRRIRNIYSVSFLHADTVLADVRTLLLEGETRGQ